METVKIQNPDMAWHIAADLHFPPDFDPNRAYPTIISMHPIGSCKEQTSGNVYGEALAREGYVVIAYDASFQGASGGEPRRIEDPTQRVEDVRRVVDYLVTLPYVDAARIGVLGICGGGGYAINATMTERRIKAVTSITGVNFGRLSREGFGGFDPIGSLEAIAAQRTAEMRGGEARVDLFLPPSVEQGRAAGITDIDVLEATDYYRTRGPQPNGVVSALFSHRGAAVGWDAFHLAEVLLTQPLLVVIGDKPGAFGA
ncbi:alpha/beta hydrolase, partial [Streptomyces sp. NPDC057020]